VGNDTMVNQGTALSFYFIKETEILIVNLSENLTSITIRN